MRHARAKYTKVQARLVKLGRQNSLYELNSFKKLELELSWVEFKRVHRLPDLFTTLFDSKRKVPLIKFLNKK